MKQRMRSGLPLHCGPMRASNDNGLAAIGGGRATCSACGGHAGSGGGRCRLQMMPAAGDATQVSYVKQRTSALTAFVRATSANCDHLHHALARIARPAARRPEPVRQAASRAVPPPAGSPTTDAPVGLHIHYKIALPTCSPRSYTTWARPTSSGSSDPTVSRSLLV